MKDLSKLIQDQATTVIRELFPDQDYAADITQSTQPQFGHYQCNSAMKLAKELGQNPRKIAEQIIEKWGKSKVVEKLEVAGPGFINIILTSDFLSKELTQVVADSRLGVSPLEKKKKVGL